MFEKLQRGLATFFSTNRLTVFAILVAIVGILQLTYSYSDKFVTRDLMTSGPEQRLPEQLPAMPAAMPPVPASTSEAMQNPSDLLPHDENSQWGEFNTLSKSANTPDLLQAGYHIGLNTVGQTLRNANLQERSDPIITKSTIGPWNQSTIEPDLARTPLEIGIGPR
jgi:hypothetical protein